MKSELVEELNREARIEMAQSHLIRLAKRKFGVSTSRMQEIDTVPKK